MKTLNVALKKTRTLNTLSHALTRGGKQEQGGGRVVPALDDQRAGLSKSWDWSHWGQVLEKPRRPWLQSRTIYSWAGRPHRLPGCPLGKKQEPFRNRVQSGGAGQPYSLLTIVRASRPGLLCSSGLPLWLSQRIAGAERCALDASLLPFLSDPSLHAHPQTLHAHTLLKPLILLLSSCS